MANPTPEIMPEEAKEGGAYVIASIISEEELRADYIILGAFDERVANAVAKAVKEKAIEQGITK